MFNKLVELIESKEDFKTYENGEHIETGIYSKAGILIYRYSDNVIIRYLEGNKSILTSETDETILNGIMGVI